MIAPTALFTTEQSWPVLVFACTLSSDLSSWVKRKPTFRSSLEVMCSVSLVNTATVSSSCR